MKTLQIQDKLSLTNNGELEIVFIGTGTPFTNELFNNNFIIIKGDAHIMVDFGFNAPQAFHQITGLSVGEISCILPTHSHSDHIGGIEYLTLFNRYIAQNTMGKEKMKMIITKEYKEILWEMSLRGGMEWNESFEQDVKMSFDDYYETLHPSLNNNSKRETFNIDYEGIKLEIFRTNHIPSHAKSISETFPSYGIYIDDRVLMTCDTKFDKELIDTYQNKSEVIFHDCSFQKNPVHADISELRSLDSNTIKKTYLMHYSDDWEQHNVDDFAGLAKQGTRYIFE